MTVDMVNHPPHYISPNGLEAITVLEAFFPDDPLAWQVGKYILRYKHKGGVEDLKKARFYLNRLIDKLTEEERELNSSSAQQTMLNILRKYYGPKQVNTWAHMEPDKVYEDNEGDLWKFVSGEGPHFSPDDGDLWEPWDEEYRGSPDRYAPFTLKEDG